MSLKGECLNQRAPCILFAEREDLMRLRVEAMLPDGMLYVYDRSLEETASAEFDDILKNHAIVALPRELFQQDLYENDLLTAESRTRYQKNLRQKLYASQAVRLVILDSGSGSVNQSHGLMHGNITPLPDENNTHVIKWPDRIKELCDLINPPGRTNHASITCILICPNSLQLNTTKEIESIRKFSGLKSIYVMTDQLRPFDDAKRLVFSRFIWPLAVGRLLARIAYGPSPIQVPKARVLAWRALDFGPKINDEDVEKYRLNTTRHVMLEPQLWIDPTEKDDTSKQQTSTRVGRLSAPEQTNPQILHGTVKAREAAENDIQKIDHDELNALSLAIKQLGEPTWVNLVNELGLSMSHAHTFSVASSVQSAEVKKGISSHFLKVHQNPAYINNIIRLVQTSEPRHNTVSQRETLQNMHEARFSVRSLKIDVACAINERDKARSRFVSLPRRLAMSGFPLLFIGGLWFVMTKKIVPEGWRIIGFVVVLLAAGLGGALGALLPWWLERKRLHLADKASKDYKKQGFQASEKWVNEGPKQLIVRAIENRVDRNEHLVISRVILLAKRLLWIIERAINDAVVPTVRDRKLLSLNHEDQDQMLEAEDKREYLDAATVSLEHFENISRDGNAELQARLNSDRNTLAQTFLIQWKDLCHTHDPYVMGHLPYNKLRPKLLLSAIEIRNTIYETYMEWMIDRYMKITGSETEFARLIINRLKPEENRMPPLLSCKVSGGGLRVGIPERMTLYCRKGSSLSLAEKIHDLLGVNNVTDSKPTEAEHLSVMGMVFQELDICFEMSRNDESPIDVLISNGQEPLFPGVAE